ncbi:MAG: transcriptional repressor [Winogradskyella sp.]|uniref:Fur family transcriptional regulator n=1 Tax=Winogradskyella sp. TaxID=1883156 RepID=UPI0025D59461|nr:transcriptional repressor [Winogradskyella sp.]NRB60347.1 transcriptional repressor [Winogradskyella sp.]
MSVVRKTKSVNTLTTIFNESTSALSVVNLVNRLKSQMNKTTVYRVLERLENDGMLHSFIGVDGLKWYAKCTEDEETHQNHTHPHFQCNDCGKVECLDVTITIPAIKNKQIESANFLITGQCENCK